MQARAKLVAEQLMAEYGAFAHARAISMSEATGQYGSAECAEFFRTVAQIIERANSDILERLAAA